VSRILPFCFFLFLAGPTAFAILSEKKMAENSNPLDSPQVNQILFHPRVTAETQAPENSVNISLEVEPGIQLGCRFFQTNTAAPTILFFHGNGEIVDDYNDVAPFYLDQNINFFVTDYRGYGWSSGTPSVSSLLKDSNTIYTSARNYLKDNGFSDILFIMGRSLGSACAIEIAAQHDDDIQGLILESGFAETLPLASALGIDLSTYGIEEEQTFNNAGKIRKVTKPTFILHGQLDGLIPLWQAEKLHAECGARSKELQVVPGADHNSLIAVGGVYYFQAIKQFVDRVSGASDWRKRRKTYKNNS
jgi:alpha-beta hydrolase superfamily lysophospholipase